MIQKIGFIGLGNIGNPMAARLLAAGYELHIYDLNKAAGENLIEAGAVWESSIKNLSQIAEVIFLSLPGPDESSQVVEEIIKSPEKNTAEGNIILDLTTNSMQTARMLEKKSLEHGIFYLDCPVSGGTAGAENGTLTALISGNPEAFEKSREIISSFSSRIDYLGENAGAGTILKLINNQIFLSTQILCAEGLVLAKKAGMDQKEVLEILKTCSSAPYISLAGLFLSEDFDTAYFPTLLANKDVAMTLKTAEELGVSMPVTEAAQSIYQKGVDGQLGSKNFTSVIQLLEAMEV